MLGNARTLQDLSHAGSLHFLRVGPCTDFASCSLQIVPDRIEVVDFLIGEALWRLEVDLGCLILPSPTQTDKDGSFTLQALPSHEVAPQWVLVHFLTCDASVTLERRRNRADGVDVVVSPHEVYGVYPLLVEEPLGVLAIRVQAVVLSTTCVATKTMLT